jgi:hypothetical protein
MIRNCERYTLNAVRLMEPYRHGTYAWPKPRILTYRVLIENDKLDDEIEIKA